MPITATHHDTINTLFAYGTLLPGEERWHILARFAVDEGHPDTASGVIYDTGLGYPAAMFDGDGVVHGRTFRLLDTSLTDALCVLDDVEGVVDGDYTRVLITTATGVRAWSYECGTIEGMTPTRLHDGNWLTRPR